MLDRRPTLDPRPQLILGESPNRRRGQHGPRG
jgi:hypothetical protein